MEQGALMGDEELEHLAITNFDTSPTPAVLSPTSAVPEGLSTNIPLPGVLPYEHMRLNIDQSLPDLAGELVTAQCFQNAEVDQREEELIIIQTDLHQEKELLKCTERDIYNCSKTVCLAQSDLAEKVEECNRLRKEISLLVSEYHSLKLEAKKAEERGKNEKEQHKEYRTLMNRHANQVKELEKVLPLQQELHDLESLLEETKAQRVNYMKKDGLEVLRGTRQKNLQETITTVNTSIAKQKEDNLELEEKLEHGRARIQKLKRELEMSNKRHAAQMTRLQRQVTEAQSRRRQWVEEVTRIRQAIQSLRHKIEE